MNPLTELNETVSGMQQRGIKVITIDYVARQLQRIIHDNKSHDATGEPHSDFNNQTDTELGSKQNRLYEPRRPPDESSYKLTHLDHLEHNAMVDRVIREVREARKVRDAKIIGGEDNAS